MTLTGWFLFFLILQLIHFAGTWKLYQKAGRKAWEALVPVYNALVLMKIINRPWWWAVLLFIPIVNLMMLLVIWVETARSFGKNSTSDTWLTVLTLGFYIYYINYALDVKYIENRSLHPKTASGGWVNSLLFAIIAATLVHTYFMQPYIIPSSSLEKSLLVGDFLFVSKFHYGARAPMTTIAAPMVHDSLPGLGIKSYVFNDNISKKHTSWLNKFQLPYFRLPGLQKIKRNEIVVFGQPADTLRDMNDFHPDRNYYKPVDKKTNLVKRCVGIPGDSLEIRDGYVYINGKRPQLPDRAEIQYSYIVKTNGSELNRPYMYQRFDVTDPFGRMQDGSYHFTALTEENAARLAKTPNVVSVERIIEPAGSPNPRIFPNTRNNTWSGDNFGPIYIPEKGKTVPLTPQTLPLYKRIIREYENNTLETKEGQILINGKQADSYTFKQDYYWMMGDNRDNSIDSRYWGYVPYNHVVGKPVLIWMSWDKESKRIRWDRVLSTVHGTGKRVSYFPHFAIVLAGWFVYSYIRKRKKKK
ncbi:signal peptidase I [Sinomicrobium weinanense]|uniref:Signal peptidase I n=1 Tax=Sinomicrobium weinanense TaxID=2842200 RepID=A0A926Q3J1_9FLAO|nr:signal peptidase I [Sinomicrobium weinanense]MBC9796061.1 signal peptidase I [Sinomicrobium weinanense]MBU3123120.1 signal peptidase I [Sinomicrobium weinanense]